MDKTKSNSLLSKIAFLFVLSFTLSSCNLGITSSVVYSEDTYFFHKHEYSEGWASNETFHWHPDLCNHGTRTDVGEHIYEEWITDSVPEDCNLKVRYRRCLICNYIEKALPSYYDTDNYLEYKINSINDNIPSEKGITFSFITDLHLLHNSLSSKELMKVVLDNTPTSFVVCGGDIVSAYCKESETAENSCDAQLATWNSLLDYWYPKRVFQVRGNHDFIVNDSLNKTFYKKTEEETFRYVISRNEDIVTYNNSLGLCYSYDHPDSNIRFLFIDDYIAFDDGQNMLSRSLTSEKMEWLIDTLDCSDDYHLIVVSHEACNEMMSECSPNMIALHNILSCFKNKKMFEGEYNGRLWYHDFSKSKGELICVLSGHSHKDEDHIKDSVLSISTTCDAPYNDDKEARIRGFVSESAFDVFNIDISNKTIKATRIGAGRDRFWNY